MFLISLEISVPWR